MNSTSTTTCQAPAGQERLAQILDEYLAAIERGAGISPAELLAKHPDDAAQLRGYLSGLNLFHAAAAGQLFHLGDSTCAGTTPPLPAIGDYRLVREIGRGGMGVVYEAWQVSLRRRVALKVLPFTAAHDAKQIGRFKNEAQAAAQVQHPNIVPVFAIGAENGVHFYVMQLIKGQSLASLLANLRSGGPPNSSMTIPNNGPTQHSRLAIGNSACKPPRTEIAALPPRANETADQIRVVASLGIQAAAALHAAHEYGIVHRDIKPSNLLLDDDGKLWVTDFGLARCREDQGWTQTGDVLGTMRYISPEQAQGRLALIDQRSDIYSLGLTLYELATLNHPADEGDLALPFVPGERPVPKPLRHWNRHIAQDFQTIVLKCLAEYPHERYATAQELADDLERFLDGRPILASPPSVFTRVRKWARRRRGLVVATAAVLTVIVVGTVVSGILLSRERLSAQENALRETRARWREQSNLLGLFNTRFPDELVAIPGAEGVAREMLQAGIDYNESFVREVGDDSLFGVEAAIAQSKLGVLNDKLGNRPAALAAHAAARTAWEKQLARDPGNAEYARNLALILNSLGLLATNEGRLGEARDMLSQARELLATLVARDPASVELATDLATTHNNLGLLHLKAEASEPAVHEFRAAIKIQEPIVNSTASEVARRALAASYHNLAALVEATNPTVAAEMYQKTVALQLALVETAPANRVYQTDLARTYSNLGYLVTRNQNWKQAEQCYRNAIELQESLAKRSPDLGAYRRDLAISCNNLGMVYSRCDRPGDAERALQKALGLQEGLLKADAADIRVLSNQGSVWNNLGMLWDQERRSADAATAYRHAIQFQTRAMQHGPTDDASRAALSRIYFNYARHLAGQNDFDQATQIVAKRRDLWHGNAERLFSVAQELAGLKRQMESTTGGENASLACVQAAVATLREALEHGLPNDRLRDASLSTLSGSKEFQQLLEERKVGTATPSNARQQLLSRVN